MPYEIADYVLFQRYFLYGSAVMTIDSPKQIKQTDANRNGKPLEISDLMHISLVVNGEIDIYETNTYPVDVTVRNDRGWMSIDNYVEIGAAIIVVRGNVNPSNLTQCPMDYAFDGTNTRILIYPEVDYWSGMCCEFVYVGTEQVISVEMADIHGRPARVTLTYGSDEYMRPFYPNPFVDTTYVEYYILGTDTGYLRIMDAFGSVVADHMEIGDTTTSYIKTFTWDARAHPDGLYIGELTYRGQKYYQQVMKDSKPDQ
jgi:hypothetical protein